MAEYDEFAIQVKRGVGWLAKSGVGVAGIALAVAGVINTMSTPDALAEQQGGTPKGPVMTSPAPGQAPQAGKNMDFENATPMVLPRSSLHPPSAAEALGAAKVEQGKPGASAGSRGDGRRKPVILFTPRPVGTKQSNPAAQPQEVGTSGQPYTTSTANAFGDLTADYYPYNATGKLWFNKPNDARTWFCSASLIKRGIAVTAAHCVANYGAQQFYLNWQFAPAFRNGIAPYGIATAKSATVLTSYYNGTDPCAQAGVICQDDVAVLTLNPPYVGANTGWYAYGWNGYSYNASGQALVTQLGYPLALDNGLLMERNDSQGFVSSSLSNNTIIGSLMTGGSSGGPWLVNFGMAPSLSGVSFGAAAVHNAVVGTTSWGYIDAAVKEQGASPFTSDNIVVLVNKVCAATPTACS
jgi:V8-like Glu-specific endopeptidase